MTRSTNAHVYELVTLLRDGPIGRRSLVSRSSMTESTVRTHLRRLEQSGYIRSGQPGTEITDSARRDFGELLRRVSLIRSPQLDELNIDRFVSVALVRDAAEQLRESIRFRDEAVRGGATGAVLLTRSEQGWRFSDLASSMNEDYPEDAQAIHEAIREAAIEPTPGDGLILSFGPSAEIAKAGLWHILASLINSTPREEQLSFG